jgi:O-antigen/teichoic acid export membrane protein
VPNRKEPFSRQIASSGIAMSTRQALGTLLSITGTLIVTRIVGPETYGLFASATAIQSYVGSLANSGVEVSLLRTHSEAADRRDAQGLLLVLGLSVTGALICLALLPWLSAWINAPRITGPAVLVFSALPLTVAWIVPRARLSRDMSFSRIAIIELVAQAGGVLLALTLAVLGAGLWAPTLGWFAQHLLLTALFFAAARPRLPIARDSVALRGLLRDSWSFAASSWIWQSKSLINPHRWAFPRCRKRRIRRALRAHHRGLEFRAERDVAHADHQLCETTR